MNLYFGTPESQSARVLISTGSCSLSVLSDQCDLCSESQQKYISYDSATSYGMGPEYDNKFGSATVWGLSWWDTVCLKPLPTHGEVRTSLGCV